MKIEGLSVQNKWKRGSSSEGFDELVSFESGRLLKPNKVGDTINDGVQDWIITDLLGEGKFRAISKNSDWGYQLSKGNNFETMMKDAGTKADILQVSETFDISGKIDTKHFVYKLNEEAIPREARKMGLEVEGKVIETAQGTRPYTEGMFQNKPGVWWKIKIGKERARLPVEAFGVFPPLVAIKEYLASLEVE